MVDKILRIIHNHKEPSPMYSDDIIKGLNANNIAIDKDELDKYLFDMKDRHLITFKESSDEGMKKRYELGYYELTQLGKRLIGV